MLDYLPKMPYLTFPNRKRKSNYLPMCCAHVLPTPTIAARYEPRYIAMKIVLIDAIVQTIDTRLLTRKQAAQLCKTAYSHLNKTLSGRTESITSITIERLAIWLTALGRSVEIFILPEDPQQTVAFPAVMARRTCPRKPPPNIGPQPGQSDLITAKLALIEVLRRTIDAHQLTHTHVAWLCGSHAANISKALQGETNRLTIDRLLNWLTALGHPVKVRVQPYDPEQKTGRFFVRSENLSLFAQQPGLPKTT
jgi:predicted XRE-type DNA-binding protein